jgi:hypothetical protein
VGTDLIRWCLFSQCRVVFNMAGVAMRQSR